MTAVTTDRNTATRDGQIRELPVAAATKIPGGAMVAINTGNGYAVNAATGTVYAAAGMALEEADNTSGAAGAIRVRVDRSKWHRWANSAGGDEITLADLNATCYIVDNATVAKTSNSNARSVAGKVRDVDASGVWVEAP